MNAKASCINDREHSQGKLPLAVLKRRQESWISCTQQIKHYLRLTERKKKGDEIELALFQLRLKKARLAAQSCVPAAHLCHPPVLQSLSNEIYLCLPLRSHFGAQD
jgi:hypothetical protein